MGKNSSDKTKPSQKVVHSTLEGQSICFAHCKDISRIPPPDSWLQQCSCEGPLGRSEHEIPEANQGPAQVSSCPTNTPLFKLLSPLFQWVPQNPILIATSVHDYVMGTFIVPEHAAQNFLKRRPHECWSLQPQLLPGASSASWPSTTFLSPCLLISNSMAWTDMCACFWPLQLYGPMPACTWVHCSQTENYKYGKSC